MFVEKGYTSPLYVGCQHHILDRVLRLLVDETYDTSTSSPNMNYEFINNLQMNYMILVEQYVGECLPPQPTNMGWRDDMQFLFQLCQGFKYNVSCRFRIRRKKRRFNLRKRKVRRKPSSGTQRIHIQQLKNKKARGQ